MKFKPGQAVWVKARWDGLWSGYQEVFVPSRYGDGHWVYINPGDIKPRRVGRGE